MTIDVTGRARGRRWRLLRGADDRARAYVRKLEPYAHGEGAGPSRGGDREPLSMPAALDCQGLGSLMRV